MDSNRGKKAIDWLTKHAYAKEVKLSRHGGGTISTLELLDDAFKYLAQINVIPVPKPLKGSWRHSFYALWLKRMAEHLGQDCKFEVWFDCGIQVDVVLTDREGVMAGYQIVLSEGEYYTAEKAIQCSKIDGLSKTVFLFERDKIRVASERDLKKRDSSLLQKIRFEFLGEYSAWS